MRLHQAQYSNVVVSHIDGLFHKRSEMNWQERVKRFWHSPAEGVQTWRGDLNGQEVVVFYNRQQAFFGIPQDEGFRPLNPEQIKELKAIRTKTRGSAKAEDTDSQGSFESSRAHAEVGRLLLEREHLTGPRLAANTKRLRQLSREFDIQLPVGI